MSLGLYKQLEALHEVLDNMVDSLIESDESDWTEEYRNALLADVSYVSGAVETLMTGL